MKPFKFFHNPITYTTFGNIPIFAGEFFYTMNKEEIESISGRILPKHIIVKRYVAKKFEEKFKPDHNVLFYFKTRESAEFYKGRLTHWDEHVVGEVFNEQSDIRITFER